MNPIFAVPVSLFRLVWWLAVECVGLVLATVALKLTWVVLYTLGWLAGTLVVALVWALYYIAPARGKRAIENLNPLSAESRRKQLRDKIIIVDGSTADGRAYHYQRQRRRQQYMAQMKAGAR